MNLPFTMRQTTEMEKYRAASFWDKEPETLAWIQSFQPDDVFFDIGANVGVYSLYAASLYPGMRIFSFEPLRMNFEALQDNAKANGFGNIYPMRCAMGRQYAIVAFIAENREAGASGGQMIDQPAGPKIQVLSVDGLCYGKHAQIHTRFERFPMPDHIKIDIDGQEMEVVEGMKRTLLSVKSVLIEVSSSTRQQVVDVMEASGLTILTPLNTMVPHSRERRAKEGIDAENIIFVR